MHFSRLFCAAVTLVQVTCLFALPIAAPVGGYSIGLYARGGPSASEDIHVTLPGHEPHIIPKGTQNIGHGPHAMNNAGVYKIGDYGAQQGPNIAKAFTKKEDMEKEAEILKKLPGQHVASGMSGDTPWIVMKNVPGQKLSTTEQFKEHVADPAKCKEYLADKHQAIAKAVQDLHAKTGMAHGDLKESNIHFVHNADGTAHANLLDFGQMHSDNVVNNVLKMGGQAPSADANQNAYSYGLLRAKQIYHPGVWCA